MCFFINQKAYRFTRNAICLYLPTQTLDCLFKKIGKGLFYHNEHSVILCDSTDTRIDLNCLWKRFCLKHIIYTRMTITTGSVCHSVSLSEAWRESCATGRGTNGRSVIKSTNLIRVCAGFITLSFLLSFTFLHSTI